jgi:hypothetical protein
MLLYNAWVSVPESGIRALDLAAFDRLARFVAGT